MYIKYQDYINNSVELEEGQMVLMSHEEFVNGGKELMNIPIAVTPNGEEPKEPDDTETIEWYAKG